MFSFSNLAVPLAFFLRLVQAAFSPITDCDEVFNYWEPLIYIIGYFHLLTPSTFPIPIPIPIPIPAFQTWEYAKEYALRTYAFLTPLHLVSKSILFSEVITLHEPLMFYGLRSVIAAFTAYTEVNYARALSTRLNSPTIFTFFLTFSILSPGMFHASSAFLPSTICMQLFLQSQTAYLENCRRKAIFWGMVCILATGWPFVGVLFLPLGLECVLHAYNENGGERANFEEDENTSHY